MFKSLAVGRWSLVIIIIIAAFLRLYNITQLPPGLYPDEAMNGNNALEVLTTGDWKVFYPENNGREGLFINIQAVFLKILMPFTGGNPEPWMLRLPSAIFGILTVLGVYFLAKEFFRNNELKIKNYEVDINKNSHNSLFMIHNSEYIALLSSFFLAASFWHINFSRIGFRAIMAPFFLTWTLYFLLKSLKTNRCIFYAILGGIFFGLGLHSYIAFRAMPLLILIIWIFYWFKNNDSRKKLFVSAIYFLIAVFVVFAPLGWHFLKNPQDFFGRTTQISIFSSPAPLKDFGMNILKTAGMFNFSGDWNWRHNYAGQPELFWPVGILFLVGIIYGFYSLFKKERKSPLLILFGWLIISALPIVISNEGIPHALRAIIMIPPAFILAGIGGILFYNFMKSRINLNVEFTRSIFYISCFAFLFILIFEAYTTYFILWARNPDVQGAFAADYAQIGKELRDLPKELPKYVIVEANGVDVRGIPMPAQTVMFLTDTFTSEKQKEKNIYYVLPKDINKIPQNAYTIILK